MGFGFQEWGYQDKLSRVNCMIHFIELLGICMHVSGNVSSLSLPA